MHGGSKPLAGLRVIDFTRVLAGPYCAMLLGDLGADVVKVEIPGSGDPLRHQGPPFLHGNGMTFLAANRNKRSLALDLKSEHGRHIARRLCAQADVLVENFRPGVMSRLGLGYDVLQADNPRLIYAAISGYGADGPDSQTGAFDLTIQALGGYMSVTGDAQGRPIKLGTSAFDLVAGMNCQAAILAALIQRGRTGRGQRIDTCLLDGQIVFLERAALGYLMQGALPDRHGASLADRAPYKAHATRDGRWVVIDGTGAQRFAALAAALHLPALPDDVRFLDDALRLKHRQALYAILDQAIATWDADALLAHLTNHEVPITRVHTIEEALAYCEQTHRRMIHTLRHPVYGDIPQVGASIRYSAFDVESGWTPPPEVGEHSAAILRDWLGEADAAALEHTASESPA